MRTFRKGGVHPHENKLTAGMPVTDAPVPSVLTLMLSQSIGAPAKCIVKPGQHVEAGELIAEPGGFVSAPVHSPVAGTVKKIDKVRTPQGYFGDAVIIERDADSVLPVRAAELPAAEFEAMLEALEPAEIIERTGAAGVVGLGGATFPTKVKLMPPKDAVPEVVILNGAECEPYLTCDDALMRLSPDGIVRGARLLMKAVGVKRCVVGIEENKPEAIEAMRKACAGVEGISVEALRTKYPQGGEKQLIDAILRLEVPSGALPVATGAIVDNVATAYAVYRAVCLGEPLTERIITLTGHSVKNPGNYRVKIGTPISDLIELGGGLPEDTGKVIGGGPMMGRAMSQLDAPVTKGLSGILIMPESASLRREPEPCIRCARCVDACPMGLEPYRLAVLSRFNELEDAERDGVMNCVECGSCSFICPSARPLLDYIKNAKAKVGAAIRARNSK